MRSAPTSEGNYPRKREGGKRGFSKHPRRRMVVKSQRSSEKENRRGLWRLKARFYLYEKTRRGDDAPERRGKRFLRESGQCQKL